MNIFYVLPSNFKIQVVMTLIWWYARKIKELFEIKYSIHSCCRLYPGITPSRPL